MKLNLWMIGEKLEKHHPQFDISEGISRITGVRIWSREPDFLPQDQYLYLDQQDNTVCLRNGNDCIVLQAPNTALLLDDLMAVFEEYNAWETSLWEASARRSPQELLDLAQSMFGNPMSLSDMSGSVLAMSSAYLDVHVSDNWVEARDTRRMPIPTVGGKLLTPDGKSGNWSSEPRLHLAPDGLRTLGMQILVEGEPAAVLVLLEHSRPLSRNDRELLRITAAVLSQVLENQTGGQIFRSRANLIGEILDGVLADPELIGQINIGLPTPWRLVLMDSPFRTDSVVKRNALLRIPEDGIPCIPLLYHTYLMLLIPDARLEEKLRKVPMDGEGQFWQIAISLPFSKLTDLRTIYDLASYTMTRTAGTAGRFHCEDFAFLHLLSRLRTNLNVEPLLHPALRLLKEQDERKNSQLYETLYQYLYHERSIQAAADAMFVHKNSFLYRLQKVRELTGLDLDDPKIRGYLLVSYLLDKRYE